MTNKTKWIIGISVGILLLANVAGFLAGVAKQKAKDAEITKLKTENQVFNTVHLGDGEIITRQEQRITDLNTAVKAGLIDLAALKAKGVKDASLIIDLKTENARLKLEATYPHPPVIIHDTVYINGQPVVNDYMKVPQLWNYSDTWTKINGVVKVTGVTVDSLITYSQPNVTMGYSKKLFNSKPIIVWSDLNPHSVVKDMSNIVIINNPPFYKKFWFHFCTGVAATLAVQYGITRIK